LTKNNAFSFDSFDRDTNSHTGTGTDLQPATVQPTQIKGDNLTSRVSPLISDTRMTKLDATSTCMSTIATQANKDDVCACVVVHEDEEIDTTTCRVVFKIMKEGDGRAIAVTAVVQCTASGASLSMDTVLSINNVSNVNTTFTAATCKTKAVPLLLPVSTSLYFFHYLLKTGPDVKPNI